MRKKYSLSKYYKIKNRQQLHKLLKDGNKILAYPVLIKWLFINEKAVPPIGTAFIVSKKKLHKATSRNRIKRIMRESFRLQKHKLEDNIKEKKLLLAVIYLSKNVEDFEIINQGIQICINYIKENIIQQNKNELPKKNSFHS